MRIGKIEGPTFINTNPTNILSNGNFSNWSNGPNQSPDGWNFFTTSMDAGVSREAVIIRLGTYSAKLTLASAGEVLISQNIGTDMGYWRGRTISCGCWVWCDIPNSAVIGIYDQVSGIESARHPGDSTWRWLTWTYKVNPAATRLDIYCDIYQIGSAYFDGVMLVEGDSSFAFADKPSNDSIIYTDVSGVSPNQLTKIAYRDKLNNEIILTTVID